MLLSPLASRVPKLALAPVLLLPVLIESEELEPELPAPIDPEDELPAPASPVLLLPVLPELMSLLLLGLLLLPLAPLPAAPLLVSLCANAPNEASDIDRASVKTNLFFIGKISYNQRW